MTNPILVFDLDGTLADTAPDLLDSLNHCLSQDGMEPADPVALKAYVGSGSRVMIERAFEARQKRLIPEKLDELQALFLEHYVTNMPGKTRLYDGVGEMLNYYAAQDFILAVCTNKMEGMSVRLLEALGIGHQFAAVCGSDTFSFRKPDPRHLFETIKMAGGNASRAVMLGDSRTDIDTAKSAGIPVIAVDFGYSDRHVREFEPSHIISHFNEVTPDLVASLLRAAAQ